MSCIFHFWMYIISRETKTNKRNMKMKKSNYELSFIDAIQACLNNKGFIRGDDFGKGLYVKTDEDGLLVIINGNNYHRKHMDLYINRELMGRKWKLFQVANQTELND